jgi:hypothetical protein
MIRHSRGSLDERTTSKVSKDEHSLNFHIKHFLIIQKQNSMTFVLNMSLFRHIICLHTFTQSNALTPIHSHAKNLFALLSP